MRIPTKQLWDRRLLTDEQLKGRGQLKRGFYLYSIIVFFPLLATVILAFINVASHAPKVIITTLLASLYKGGPMNLLLPLFLLSPYLVLRGSNNARTLSGVAALLLALGLLPGFLGVFSHRIESIIAGVACMLAFPILCYLTNVFLISENVKSFIGVIRSRRGLSAESWKLDD